MSKLLKNLIKIKFEDMFARWFEDKQRDTPRESCIHGSDIVRPDVVEDGKGDQRFCYRECILKHYYKAPEKENKSSFLNKIFFNGWKLHEKWQGLFEKYSKVKEIEKTTWDDEYKIAYTPDAILEINGKDFIVEIKGWKQEEYDKYDENGPCPESPKKQAFTYCFLKGVKNALVLIENKNTAAFKLWHLVFSEEAAKDVIERLENLKKYLEKWLVNRKFLPSKICESKKEERACICSMADVCFASDTKRKKMVKDLYVEEC